VIMDSTTFSGRASFFFRQSPCKSRAINFLSLRPHILQYFRENYRHIRQCSPDRVELVILNVSSKGLISETYEIWRSSWKTYFFGFFSSSSPKNTPYFYFRLKTSLFVVQSPRKPSSPAFTHFVIVSDLFTVPFSSLFLLKIEFFVFFQYEC
jgi:hypothetical protein